LRRMQLRETCSPSGLRAKRVQAILPTSGWTIHVPACILEPQEVLPSPNDGCRCIKKMCRSVHLDSHPGQSWSAPSGLASRARRRATSRVHPTYWRWIVPSKLLGCLISLLLLAPSPARTQMIRCVQPPSATPTEAACRIAVEAGEREMILVLQLLSRDNKPAPAGTWVRLITLEGTGTIPDSAITEEDGLVHFTWRGIVRDQPNTIVATTTIDKRLTRREIRITRKEPGTPAAIDRVAPTGGHSAFAGKYLADDVEVLIETDPTTCIRTNVVFEYLSVGTAAAPEPKRIEVPALWSETDPGTFRCTAQLRWVLSPAVGKQELRTWIKRDSTFVLPTDAAGAHKYLKPHVIHAVAHAQPAFLAGAAVVDSTEGVSVPQLVGLSLSFPSFAEYLKHRKFEEGGWIVDRLRIFAATEFKADLGRTVYLGFEPIVLLVGPRAADLPVAVAAGRRMGKGENRWFAAGLVNAGQLAGLVAQALGFGGSE